MIRFCFVLALALLVPMTVALAGANDPASSNERENAAGDAASEPEIAELAEALKELHADRGDASWQTIQRGLLIPTPRDHRGICLAADPNLCDYGARLMQERPCLAAGDCPAYESWQQVMGESGVRPAPESAIRAAGLVPATRLEASPVLPEEWPEPTAGTDD